MNICGKVDPPPREARQDAQVANTTMTCGWCQATIPADAERCPKCQGSIATGNQYRAETTPSQPLRVPEAEPAGRAAVQLVRLPKVAPLPIERRPGALIFAGVVLAIVLGLVAGVILAVDEKLGPWAVWAASFISGSVLFVGLVAKAVELGIVAARHAKDMNI